MSKSCYFVESGFWVADRWKIGQLWFFWKKNSVANFICNNLSHEVFFHQSPIFLSKSRFLAIFDIFWHFLTPWSHKLAQQILGFTIAILVILGFFENQLPTEKVSYLKKSASYDFFEKKNRLQIWFATTLWWLYWYLRRLYFVEKPKKPPRSLNVFLKWIWPTVPPP